MLLTVVPTCLALEMAADLAQPQSAKVRLLRLQREGRVSKIGIRHDAEKINTKCIALFSLKCTYIEAYVS